jgi:hypothetical protein
MNILQETEQAKFIRAYLECAAWCGVPEEDRNGGEFHADDFHAEAEAQATEDCRAFLGSVPDSLLEQWSAEQAGHDFWMTRNRHGAGFWDRGHGAAGAELTKLAHSAGERGVYVGDDGYLRFESA